MHFFQLIQKPVYQGLICIILTIIGTVVIRPKIADNVWVICGLMYCLFIVSNSILSFYAIDTWPYFFISLGFSLLYLVLIAIIANILINSLSLKGSGESAMIFIVVIFHPVALLLSIFLKWAFVKMF